MRLKKKIKVFICLFIFLVLVGLSLVFYYNYNLRPVSSNDDEVVVEISSGDSAGKISSMLKKNKLIRNETIFKLYLKLNKVNKLQAGKYSLRQSMSLDKIVYNISNGKVKGYDEISITFKEGKNMRGIASIIDDYTNNSREDVMELLKDESYIDELISTYWFLTDEIKNKEIYYPLEGYLFPDTYNFRNKDVTVKEIFKVLLSQTDKVLSKYKDSISAKNMTIHEYLTLASIVELEGVNDDDRASIAGVFYNRLDIKMPLGSDVTTYYAIKVEVTERDLYMSEIKDANAYNTRSEHLAGKLPVGPVCNPGEASIKATISPVDHDYLYFIADKYKNTYFTKTYAEHEAKKNELIANGMWFTY